MVLGQLMKGSLAALLFSNFFFMSGYITLRLSLTIYLLKNGYSSNDAYAISMSASALFALCSLAWGLLYNRISQDKNLILAGVAITLFSYLLLLLHSKIGQILGISLYVVGSSMYFININLLVNKHFNENKTRQRGNHVYQLIFNAGAFVGILLLASFFSKHGQVIYLLSPLMMLASLITLAANNKNIILSDTHLLHSHNAHAKIAAIVLSMLVFVYMLLHYDFIARYMLILAFVLSNLYIVYLIFTEKNQKYLIFVVMMLCCSFIYWLANAIFYNQFTVFLSNDVGHTFFGISFSPLALLILDPVANIMIGYAIYTAYKHKAFAAHTMLSLGLVLLLIAFLVLSFSLTITPDYHEIAFYWPAISIIFFAGAEFLIQTTLNAQVSHLISNVSRQGFFMAMLQITRAFSAVIAFYLVGFNAPHSSSIKAITTSDAHIYIYLSFIIFIAGGLFIILSKKRGLIYAK